MIGYLDAQKFQMKEQKIVLGDIVFHQPTEIIKTEKDLQCAISQQTELKTLRGKIRTFSTLIAISSDNGITWKFVDTSNMDLAMVRKVYPNLSNKIKLPQSKSQYFQLFNCYVV